MKDLAIVTGGTRGIGRAIAQGLHDAGYQVISVYRNNDASAQAFHEATSIRIAKWDVADFDACQKGIEQLTAEFGPVKILINNAGITRDTVLHKMSIEQWQAVIQTNLGSMFNMCRPIVPSMRDLGFGRIINISSINAQRGQFGQTNYAAAKAGILGFTKSLALENARKNITVNAITPGYCDTEMVAKVPPEVLKKIVEGIPVGRLGLPSDIAGMVLFLVGQQANYITGATFDINGGLHLH